MDPTVIAHGAGGHWIVDLGIYLGPLLTIVGVVLLSDRRRRRREAEAERLGAEPS